MAGRTAPAADGKAAELVREGLQAEADGRIEDRATLLDRAIDESENFAPARWHSGQLFHAESRQWISHERVPGIIAENKQLLEYRAVRSAYSPSITGQLRLARWCVEHDLPDQARAHLTAVLEQNPNHRQARQLLGHIQVNGNWIPRSQLLEAVAEDEQAPADAAAMVGLLERLQPALYHSQTAATLLPHAKTRNDGQ